jgi:hypothetical protein
VIVSSALFAVTLAGVVFRGDVFDPLPTEPARCSELVNRVR